MKQREHALCASVVIRLDRGLDLVEQSHDLQRLQLGLVKADHEADLKGRDHFTTSVYAASASVFDFWAFLAGDGVALIRCGYLPSSNSPMNSPM